MNIRCFNLFLLSISLLFLNISYAGRKIVVPHDFPTIHSALGESRSGDTVYVTVGKYKENIALPDSVVLMGQGKNRTIISSPRRRVPCIIGADGATITNFTIKNGSVGILCENKRPNIKNNIIISNRYAGIHALITLPDIKYNIISKNGVAGIFLESSRGTRTSIDHNVLLKNGFCGIFCAHRTEVLIRNNIFYKNLPYGVYIAQDSKKTRIIYNNFYKNRKPFNPFAVVNRTNINVVPRFIAPNRREYNFFVSKTSGCKGRGQNGSDIGLITEKMIVDLSTDRDGDGIDDDIDQCPDVAEDRDSFEDEDGCPDFDNDGDGIADINDKCPDVPEDIDDYNDKDGCPDNDNDKDGILDKDDKCPYHAETVNGYKDNDGCPDEKPREIKQVFILKGISFKTASAELLEESYYVLDNIYKSLEAYPKTRLEIRGHTDSMGSSTYNKGLSLKRAKSVMAYLVMKGISTTRLYAKGYGETKPIADNNSADGRSQNRRIEIIPIK